MTMYLVNSGTIEERMVTILQKYREMVMNLDMMPAKNKGDWGGGVLCGPLI